MRGVLDPGNVFFSFPTMMVADDLKPIPMERERRLASCDRVDMEAHREWAEAVLRVPEAASREQLLAAYEYARQVPYAHPGVSPEVYFCHSLRVATWSLRVEGAGPIERGIVGLFHNVLETSPLTREELAGRYGSSVANQIAALTVDRARETDLAYKPAYYQILAAGPRAARVAKIFDKFDNLFLLGLNPNEEARTRYLAEVREFIVPMARREVPEVEPYLGDLLRDCEIVGYFGTRRL
jgi:(p)ppGpp synthase/HD superfamily hydrolase